MNFNPILLSIKIKPDIILDMVKVETEPFFIGGENGSFDGMKRVVNIEKDFYISKFEITQKQWAAIMQCKHSKKCTFYTLRFGCSFAAVNTIKPQLL